MKTNHCKSTYWLVLLLVWVMTTSVQAWEVTNTSTSASVTGSLPWVVEQINNNSSDNIITFDVSGSFPSFSITGQLVHVIATLGQQSFANMSFTRGVTLRGIHADDVSLGSMAQGVSVEG